MCGSKGCGIGRIAEFECLHPVEIEKLIKINTTSAISIIRAFYHRIKSHDDFYCGVMVSIAGFMSSPFFSVYAATKAALKIFIESVNVELLKAGSTNQILNVSPGSLKGTSFTNSKTDLTVTAPMAQAIIAEMEKKNDLFIPQYEEVFKNVLRRYQDDFRKEGAHSYDYKLERMKNG